MILDSLVYLIVFIFVAALSWISQSVYNGTAKKDGDSRSHAVYFLMLAIALSPVIAMFGLRYGIGTDYFAYETTYNILHEASFEEYWYGFSHGLSYYYVEPGYFLLNKLFPSYRLLLWGLGILMFALVALSLKKYARRLSIPLALFVCLCTQYLYSLNGMRFAVALCFILFAYTVLAEGNSKKTVAKYVLLILAASLFHTSSLICLPLVLLVEFNSKKVNRFRDVAFLILILSFPLLISVLSQLAASLPFFSRYFSTAKYTLVVTAAGGLAWLLHILPVVIPLLLFCRDEIFDDKETRTYFRIMIAEFPFRMLGLYNTWLTRLARFSQIVQIIMIPLILSKIKNPHKRTLLTIYYCAWYVIDFIYYAIVNDGGASLPYIWIFSM